MFLIAAGVRILVWQNNKAGMNGVQYVVTGMYKDDARTLLSGEISSFLAGPNPPFDATILEHPPGYPLFIACVYGIFGENVSLWVIQILISSLASILAFFIALSLFDFRTAVIAGILIALSPQFAYYSGIILPDELSVLPILAAVYFLVRAVQDRQLTSAIFCGVSIGLSCWLRSNALILPVFFAGISLILLPKQFRTRFALILLASFVLTISPITIRNFLVFHSFIPLSLGAGTTFIEGLSDCDDDGRLGLPSTDEGVMEMDARNADRPDYYGNLYSPDGVERERERIKIGLAAVRDNPLWFLTSVAKRGTMVFRMERVPVIAPERDEKTTTEPIFYYLNIPLKYIQQLFITVVFLPLFLFGAILLLRKKEHQIKLFILAVVTIYYVCVQSLLHTEYRYLLPASHFLLIVSSVALGSLIDKVSDLKLKMSDV